MTQVVSALRIMGIVLHGATELALLALFSMAVAADGLILDEVACLILHCLANMLIWATEIYTIVRRDRDPHDIAYLVINALLVVITATAFSLYAYHLAQGGSGKLDFATFGAPAAYAVLIMSWLVTMLAIQALIFSGADKCRPSSADEKAADEQIKPKRAVTIDWSRRPLPLTIINVVHTGGADLNQIPHTDALPKYEGPGQLPVAQTPMKTTYNHWPDEV